LLHLRTPYMGPFSTEGEKGLIRGCLKCNKIWTNKWLSSKLALPNRTLSTDIVANKNALPWALKQTLRTNFTIILDFQESHHWQPLINLAANKKYSHWRIFMFSKLSDHKLLVGSLSALIFSSEQTFLAQRIAKDHSINHRGIEALKIFACVKILNISDLKKFGTISTSSTCREILWNIYKLLFLLQLRGWYRCQLWFGRSVGYLMWLQPSRCTES